MHAHGHPLRLQARSPTHQSSAVSGTLGPPGYVVTMAFSVSVRPPSSEQYSATLSRRTVNSSMPVSERHTPNPAPGEVPGTGPT